MASLGRMKVLSNIDLGRHDFTEIFASVLLRALQVVTGKIEVVTIERPEV